MAKLEKNMHQTRKFLKISKKAGATIRATICYTNYFKQRYLEN